MITDRDFIWFGVSEDNPEAILNVREISHAIGRADGATVITMTNGVPVILQTVSLAQFLKTLKTGPVIAS